MTANRSVLKALRYTPEEWAEVAAFVEAWGLGFSEYARTVTLHREVKVSARPNPVDVLRVRSELSKLGNNLNQIARRANVHGEASPGDLAAARALLERCSQVVEHWAVHGHGSLPAGGDAEAEAEREAVTATPEPVAPSRVEAPTRRFAVGGDA